MPCFYCTEEANHLLKNPVLVFAASLLETTVFDGECQVSEEEKELFKKAKTENLKK